MNMRNYALALISSSPALYIEGIHVFIVNTLADQKTIYGRTQNCKKEEEKEISARIKSEETRPAYMLLSGKVFAVCRQIADDFSNMSASSFLFHPIASFISSQGSALEILDRKQIEMLNLAFDIRPHNIQCLKKGLYMK